LLARLFSICFISFRMVWTCCIILNMFFIYPPGQLATVSGAILFGLLPDVDHPAAE
jgi:hypothetical protein